MNTVDRFWKYIIPEPNSGCWLWDGATQKGYGALLIGSRLDGSRHMVRAHRLSWMLFRSEIPNGIDVCHRCDVRICVNPDHLFLGSRKENIQDASIKGRLNPWHRNLSHCKHGHPLSGDNLRYTAGKRRCRECSRIRTQQRRERLKGGI